MTAAPLRLQCSGMCKSYPGVLALDGVNLDLAAGTVHALVGENGAGKSTLVKLLSGAAPPDAGSVEIDGENVSIRNARHAQQLGIAVVYQEFNLAPDLSVSENIFLGRWPSAPRRPWIDFPKLHDQTAALLATLGIRLSVRQPVSTLSVAQQQMVEIAKALSLDAKILILDEPSAVLTPHELDTLFELVKDLKNRGVGVIYISHRLDEIFRIADDVTVLRDGRNVSTRTIQTVERDRLITEMVGRELKNEFPPRCCTIGDVLLRFENLTARNRFNDVTLDVRAGEVLALTGLVGSGRTSVAQTAFGAVRADEGTVSLAGRHRRFTTPRQAIAEGVAMLPEDRRREGLLLERSIRENITLADPGASATWGFLSHRRERNLTRRLMNDLQIKALSPDTQVATLSGGNQQKVLLARWMARSHRAMILDEPTRGVDVGAKYEIYTLINRLAAEGVALLLISSELPEVIGMADRIGVMHEGRLMDILDNPARATTQEQIMRLAAGEIDTR